MQVFWGAKSIFVLCFGLIAACTSGSGGTGLPPSSGSSTPAQAGVPPTTPVPETAPVEVELVQTPGRFETQGLKLTPGNYVFKITNQGIKHEVGFYLQKRDKNGKPVEGSEAGHVKDGETVKTGVVRLEKGTYVYSCPLNPTPHYTITVE